MVRQSVVYDGHFIVRPHGSIRKQQEAVVVLLNVEQLVAGVPQRVRVVAPPLRRVAHRLPDRPADRRAAGEERNKN